ncbi:MAG: hypothetical protein ACOYN5_14000, partial [Bacteroidales bacterium]|jgi:hypothetical protein
MKPCRPSNYNRQITSNPFVGKNHGNRNLEKWELLTTPYQFLFTVYLANYQYDRLAVLFRRRLVNASVFPNYFQKISNNPAMSFTDSSDKLER